MPPKTKLCATPDQPSVYSLASKRRHRRHRSVEAPMRTPEGNPNNLELDERKKRTPPTPPSQIHITGKEVKRTKSEMEKEGDDRTPEEIEEDEELGELTPELRKLDLLIKRNLRIQLRPLKVNINELLETAKTTSTHSVEINNLKQENKVLKHRCNQLEQEQQSMKERLDKLENFQLENNLMLFGVEESSVWEYPENRYAKVVDYLSHTMNGESALQQRDMARNLSIKKTVRIGKFNPDRCRPISITFTRNEDVDYLLANKRYLPNGIFLNKEFTADIERKRKLLRPILKLAKQHPDFKDKCHMDGDALKIKSKRYTLDNLHQLPDEINGFKASSKRNAGVLCFYGELNPFSNFHPAEFELDGEVYRNSEQYIQQQKAIMFDDKLAEAKIMSASTALQCKNEARKIRGFNQQAWNAQAKSLCSQGIEAKFRQHEWLRKLLVSTGSDILVEACHDNIWGSGKPLFHLDCTDQTRWSTPGQPGILGEILMSIRDKMNPPAEFKTAQTNIMSITPEHMDAGAEEGELPLTQKT